MKTIFPIVLISFLLTGLLFGQDDIDKDTPIFREGIFKGQTVDQSIWTHAQDATPEQIKELQKNIKPENRGEYHYFQNVKHANRYTIAAVPKSVMRVDALMNDMALNGKVGHGFLSFYFDHPMILMSKEGRGRPEFSKGLVVSTDGARPVGEPFSAKLGFGPNLILHTNFTTIEQAYIDYRMNETDGANRVTSIKLQTLKPDQRERLLTNSIEMSKSTGYDRVYNTFSTSNCCGQVFQLLDSILPKPSFLGKCRLSMNHVSSFLPGLYRDALRVRGLYNKKLEGKWVDDPLLQAATSHLKNGF